MSSGPWLSGASPTPPPVLGARLPCLLLLRSPPPSSSSPRRRGPTEHSSFYSAAQERSDGENRAGDTTDGPAAAAAAAHDASQGHVRSMLGRGVKRKWSCLEEAEVVSEAAEDKRQDEDEDGQDGLLDPSGSDVSRLQQRQLVLGLCLEKLQRYQAGVELSLRRSVLLINTLRQIQEEMRSDGVGGCDVHPDSCLLRDDFREDVTVTCPGCSEGEGPPELGSQEADGSDQQKPPVGDAVSAVGYLGDLALDDIFEDIDTSMYETSDLPSAWASGPLWPLSVSLWPDEDVKLRPQSHPTAGSLQSCLMDLNELDHIMEILVKS